MPVNAPGGDLVIKRAVHADSIKRHEQRATDNHGRVVKKVVKLRCTCRESNGETIDDNMGDNQPVLPKGDANFELYGNVLFWQSVLRLRAPEHAVALTT